MTNIDRMTIAATKSKRSSLRLKRSTACLPFFCPLFLSVSFLSTGDSQRKTTDRKKRGTEKTAQIEAPMPFDDSQFTISQQVIAGRKIRLLLLTRPESILNEVGALSPEDVRQTDPYWGTLWPSAVSTAKLVLSQSWPAQQPALEIGCGTGLVGVAGLLAGLNVTFSDLVPEAVELAQHNAALNGFDDAPGMRIDWRSPPVRQFELILASDVLYSTELHEPLIEVLDRMLAPGGVCWIGDPGRATVREFLHRLPEQRFSVTLKTLLNEPCLIPSINEFQLLVVSRR